MSELRHGERLRLTLEEEKESINILRYPPQPALLKSGWRSRIANWCYNLVDHFDENRKIVYVAFNVFDRYCAYLFTQQSVAEVDACTYKVASVTAIILASRIAGLGHIKLKELVAMDGGDNYHTLTAQDIIATGGVMIQELDWDCKICTAHDFVELFLYLTSLHNTTKSRIYDSTTYLVELSVFDTNLVSHQASDVAFCALVLRMNEQGWDTKEFTQHVQSKANYVIDSTKREFIIQRLQSTYDDTRAHDEWPHIVLDDDESVATQSITSQQLPAPKNNIDTGRSMTMTHCVSYQSLTDMVKNDDQVMGKRSRRSIDLVGLADRTKRTKTYQQSPLVMSQREKYNVN